MIRYRRPVLVWTMALACACGSGGGDAEAGAAPPIDPVGEDSVGILADLAYLAADSLEGRAPGTQGSAAARRLILQVFREAGLEPVHAGPEPPDASLTDSFPVRRRDGSEVTGVNVVGRIPGTVDSLPAIVVTAHYDHVGVRNGEIYNGADDNASGTAAVLFLARHLSRWPLRHPVILATLDAEESGLLGGRRLAESLDPAGVLLNVNLDMLARTAGVLWAAGAHHTPTLRPLLEDVAARSPLTLRLGHDRPDAPEGDDWTRSSDHAAFHARGVPFVYFGVEDHPDYHRPTDDVERVVPGEYLNAIRTVLLALHTLDERFAPTPQPARP